VCSRPLIDLGEGPVRIAPFEAVLAWASGSIPALTFAALLEDCEKQEGAWRLRALEVVHVPPMASSGFKAIVLSCASSSFGELCVGELTLSPESLLPPLCSPLLLPSQLPLPLSLLLWPWELAHPLLSAPRERELCPVDSLAEPMYPLSHPFSLSELVACGDEPCTLCGEGPMLRSASGDVDPSARSIEPSSLSLDMMVRLRYRLLERPPPPEAVDVDPSQSRSGLRVLFSPAPREEPALREKTLPAPPVESL